MCGIAGILGPPLDASSNQLWPTLVAMTDQLAHRGPDGQGQWSSDDNCVGLGHRRLSIVDLSEGGKQPMHGATGRYTITFNGEIYNYIELRAQLEKEGYHFRSSSDTEVLLASYAAWGARCLEQLDGMFAFAIWDATERTLFCARDRFGEKPFFYAVHQGRFYFASEMKALWAAGVARTPNDAMLFRFLANDALQNRNDLSETFYREIRKLKAAHYFTIRPDNLVPRQHEYWRIDPELVDAEISEEAAASRFRELFDESVKRRLRSDVAVGSSLSGGLDSSLVVCTIDQIRQGCGLKQATFSARFPGYAKDESKYMQYVIDRTYVEPHFVVPDENRLVDDWEAMVQAQEEPFNSASIYAQYCVMRLAKEHQVTVLLDGQGADELLAGYLFYYPIYLRELKGINRQVWRTESAAYNQVHGTTNGHSRSARLRFMMGGLLPTPVRMKIYRAKLRQRLSQRMHPDFVAAQADDYLHSIVEAPRTLAHSLHHSAFGGDLENLLRYADRNSMAHSREVRLPFLSHDLAEFVFRLPANLKLRQGITKFIMRKAYKNLLPPEINNRTDKIGYEPPQQQWLQSAKLREKIAAANNYLEQNSYIQRGSLENGLSPHGKPWVWSIMMAHTLFSA